jgi:site-specific DNA recombinase
VKAALYARYSTDMQRDASIDDQFRECDRVARTAGFDVVARFEDKGISGGTADRPGYQALLSATRRGEFSVIVVEDISRLWRNRAEFGARSAEFEDFGVHCVTAVGDDTRRDGWGLIIQIKQAVAEHARREASYRTRRGLEGRAIKGESAGGRAYGYRPASQSTTGQVEIIETEAAVVRRIFELYASGISSRAIAECLNCENIPSPGSAWRRNDTGEHAKRRGKWVGSAIHGDPKRGYGILNNERYLGRLNWGRLHWKRGAANSKKRVAVLADPALMVRREDPRLRIISDELWERVKQRQLAQISRPTSAKASSAGRPATSLLSGLLVCGECGSRFVARNQRSYQCASRIYGGSSACSNQIVVPRKGAEVAIVKYLAADLLSPEAIEIAKREYQAAVLEDAKQEHKDSAKDEALRAEEALLRKMLRDRTLSPDVAQAALDAVANKRRKAVSTVKMPPANLVQTFALTAERYVEVVKNLGKHVTKSAHSTEERDLVREMLGGYGTVFSRDGSVGARFDSVGLSDNYKLLINQGVEIGSGGVIRNYNSLNCHDIYFDRDARKRRLPGRTPSYPLHR